jgi:hypothetical protein
MNAKEKKDFRSWFLLFAIVFGILLILIYNIIMPKDSYWIIAAVLWLPASIGFAYFMAKLKS